MPSACHLFPCGPTTILMVGKWWEREGERKGEGEREREPSCWFTLQIITTAGAWLELRQSRCAICEAGVHLLELSPLPSESAVAEAGNGILWDQGVLTVRLIACSYVFLKHIWFHWRLIETLGTSFDSSRFTGLEMEARSGGSRQRKGAAFTHKLPLAVLSVLDESISRREMSFSCSHYACQSIGIIILYALRAKQEETHALTLITLDVIVLKRCYLDKCQIASGGVGSTYKHPGSHMVSSISVFKIASCGDSNVC